MMAGERDAEALLAALAPLVIAADVEAKAARAIAAIRTDPIERAIYLDRAARWQRLFDAAAAAIEAAAIAASEPPNRRAAARRVTPLYAAAH